MISKVKEIIIQSEVVSTNKEMPDGTKFLVKTFYHPKEEMYVSDLYMFDGRWTKGYDPMKNEDFDCRIFHDTVCTHRKSKSFLDSLNIKLQILHNKACNDITSGKYCSGVYMFS